MAALAHITTGSGLGNVLTECYAEHTVYKMIPGLCQTYERIYAGIRRSMSNNFQQKVFSYEEKEGITDIVETFENYQLVYDKVQDNSILDTINKDVYKRQDLLLPHTVSKILAISKSCKFLLSILTTKNIYI